MQSRKYSGCKTEGQSAYTHIKVKPPSYQLFHLGTTGGIKPRKWGCATARKSRIPSKKKREARGGGEEWGQLQGRKHTSLKRPSKYREGVRAECNRQLKAGEMWGRAGKRKGRKRMHKF